MAIRDIVQHPVQRLAGKIQPEVFQGVDAHFQQLCALGLIGSQPFDPCGGDSFPFQVFQALEILPVGADQDYPAKRLDRLAVNCPHQGGNPGDAVTGFEVNVMRRVGQHEIQPAAGGGVVQLSGIERFDLEAEARDGLVQVIRRGLPNRQGLGGGADRQDADGDFPIIRLGLGGAWPTGQYQADEEKKGPGFSRRKGKEKRTASFVHERRTKLAKGGLKNLPGFLPQPA